MVTLTQTVFDVADCNVTLLHYVGAAAPGLPLAFSSADTYNELYQKIAEGKVSCAALLEKPCEILDVLRSAYLPNKFWQRYLGSRDEETYAAEAWQSIVPIAATLNQKIEVVLPAGMNLQVSPVPRVLLFPFGWSTWISFRIVGAHSLEELAALSEHLTDGAAYKMNGNAAAKLTLTEVFDVVGKGVRNDAYGGKNAAVFNPQDILGATTVMSKHGGSPSLGALTADQAVALKRIVRSAGAAQAQTLAVPLPHGESKLLDFVLHDGLWWFLWAEHRLLPFGRNEHRLRCYHNNTFRSLEHSWLLQTFLDRAIRAKPWSPVLADLVERAMLLLTTPTYKNFSLLEFLERKDFETVRTAAQKRLAPPPGQ
jgi:hypothetical protein